MEVAILGLLDLGISDACLACGYSRKPTPTHGWIMLNDYLPISYVTLWHTPWLK